MSNRHYNARSGVAGALVLIAIGVLLLLNQNGILRFADIWRLWPLALVAGGLVRLTQIGSTSRFMGGLMVVLGLVLEASEFHLIPYRVWDLWPLCIIALGLMLLWQSLRPPEEREIKWKKFDFQLPLAGNLAIFGGGERHVNSPDFTRADILAIFGGYKLDLRKSTIKGDSAVDRCHRHLRRRRDCRAGDLERDCTRRRASSADTATKRTFPTASESAPELIVQGVAIFGGVAIKN